MRLLNGFLLARLVVGLLWAAGVLLTAALLLVNFNPLGRAFQTDILIVNESGQAIRYTPMGMAHRSRTMRPLPRFVLSVPLLPAVTLAGLPLPEDGEAAIRYDRDDIDFTTLLVHGSGINAAARELVVPRAGRRRAAENRLVVPPLGRLPRARPEVLAAEAAFARNPRALLLWLPLGGPFLIAAAWIMSRRLARRARETAAR